MFEWNEQKATRNVREHKGVTFEEAATIFDDPDVYIEDDAGHSDEEDRFVALGVSEKLRVLFVCFTYRGENIRLISARKATPRERKHYERNKTD
jgi:uncharacterized protein